MRHVGTDENNIAAREVGDMSSYMPDAGQGFHKDQFIFGVIVPVKIVFQAGGKELERLAGIGEYYFLLDLHRWVICL